MIFPPVPRFFKVIIGGLILLSLLAALLIPPMVAKGASEAILVTLFVIGMLLYVAVVVFITAVTKKGD